MRFVMFIAALSLSSFTFADSPCSISLFGENSREAIVNYYGDYDPNNSVGVSLYNGHVVLIDFQKPTECEPQAYLKISLDGGDSYSMVYDPAPNTLYQHGLGDGTLVQCYFENVN